MYAVLRLSPENVDVEAVGDIATGGAPCREYVRQSDACGKQSYTICRKELLFGS